MSVSTPVASTKFAASRRRLGVGLDPFGSIPGLRKRRHRDALGRADIEDWVAGFKVEIRRHSGNQYRRDSRPPVRKAQQRGLDVIQFSSLILHDDPCRRGPGARRASSAPAGYQYRQAPCASQTRLGPSLEAGSTRASGFGLKLFYVTSTLPYGRQEAFIIPEIAELLRTGHDVTVVPMRPRGAVVHDDALALLPRTRSASVLSAGIMAGALAEAVIFPGRTAKACRLLLHSRSPGILLKNTAVFTKGVWLARSRQARLADVKHIPAHWASASSTMAFVAATVSRIPWSFTASPLGHPREQSPQDQDVCSLLCPNH